MTLTRIALSLGVGLLAAMTAVGAGAAPADTQAFSTLPAIYASFELTATGKSEFGAAKDALTDGAHQFTRTAKFEVSLNKAMPDACPLSTMTASSNPALEQGGCIGWMATLPDGASAGKVPTTGKVDLSTNPMFVPVEYSIDDLKQFRHRNTPSDGFATEATTTKGRGVAYMSRSGMLMCDLKSMTCDMNNVLLNYDNGTDVVNVTKVSDVPGFETKHETVGPRMLLPQFPDALARQLGGFALTLPLPFTKTFSGPAANGDGTVTIKMTVSANPASKAPASAH
jgi:hypothetical protein